MIVYRVEHESITNPMSGMPYGPCRVGDIRRHMTLEQELAYDRALHKLRDHLWDNTDTLPTPIGDYRLGYIDPDEVCGTLSLKDVHTWFADSLPLLEEAGFRVHRYEVPDKYAKCGMSGQVVFRVKYAKRVQEEVSSE